MRKLLKWQGTAPRAQITDKLRSYGAFHGSLPRELWTLPFRRLSEGFKIPLQSKENPVGVGRSPAVGFEMLERVAHHQIPVLCDCASVISVEACPFTPRTTAVIPNQSDVGIVEIQVERRERGQLVCESHVEPGGFGSLRERVADT